MAVNNLIETSGFSYTLANEPEWFYKSLKNAKTIDKGYVRVLPNVTDQIRVKKVVMSPVSVSQVDNRDCSWDSTDHFALDEKLFTVHNMKVNIDQCMSELDNVYSEMIFNSIGALKDEWPKVGSPESLEDVIMFHIQHGLSLDIEKQIWGSESNSVDGIHDGIIDKLLLDPDTIKVSNPVTIDSTNVLSEIARVWEQIPDNVLNDGEYDPEKAAVRLFVSSDIYRSLKQALSTASTQYLVQLPSFTIDNGVIRYLGVEIVSVGLPAQTMLAASRDNLVVVTDLLSDTQQIEVGFGKEIFNKDRWFARGQYRFDAGYIFADECVLYMQ